MAEKPYDFDRPLPCLLRVGLAAAGLFCIIMPAYEFRSVFIHPSVLTLFFGGLTAGAWFVGFGVLGAAILGAGQKWRFQDHKLMIERTQLLKTWNTEISRANLASSGVREIQNDSGPNSFSVVLTLADGKSYETHGLDTPEAAEKFRLRIESYLV